MKWRKITLEIIEIIFITLSSGLTIYSIIEDKLKFIPNNFNGIIIFILVMIFIIIIIYKIRNLVNTPWVQCKGFPNEKYPEGERICAMVEYCLSNRNNKRYAKEFESVYLTSDGKHDDIFKDFFYEISKFLNRSKYDLKMTLPQNPYYHIKDDVRKDLFRNTAINAQKAKIKKKEKIICLTTNELNEFIFDLKSDISKHLEEIKKSKNAIFLRKKNHITDFEEYIFLHKNISLFWHKDSTKSIDEFIIVDECACIACDSTKITISFSSDEIGNKTTKFKDIGEKETTTTFLKKHVIPTIEKDTIINQDDKKYYIEYLKRIK